MITFNFSDIRKSCDDCEALLINSNDIYYCVLGNSITSGTPRYPVNPCNRPVSPDDLLTLLMSIYWYNT